MTRRISSSRPITGSSLPARALGEIDGVFVQRLALTFGFLRVDRSATAHRLDRLLERLAREAVFLDEAPGLALVVGERE